MNPTFPVLVIIYLIGQSHIVSAFVQGIPPCPTVQCLQRQQLVLLEGTVYYLTASTTLFPPLTTCQMEMFVRNGCNGYDILTCARNTSGSVVTRTLRMCETNVTGRTFDAHYLDIPNTVFGVCVVNNDGVDLTNSFCTPAGPNATRSSAAIRTSTPIILDFTLGSLKQDFINHGVPQDVVNQIQKNSFENCSILTQQASCTVDFGVPFL